MLPISVGTFLAIALAAAAPPTTQAKPATAARAFDLQGHRGGRGLWPENTLTAFAGALSLGVDTLELDASVTKDGVVIVSHDPLINPDITRDAKGAFVLKHGPAFFSLDYAEVATYDVGRIKPGTPYALLYPEQKGADGVRIPRLADVFDLVKRSGNEAVRFNIETKITPQKPDETPNPQAFAEAVVKVIRAAKMEKRTTIQSFDWRTLAVVQKIAPEIDTVTLTTLRPDGGNVQPGKPGTPPGLAGVDVDNYGGSVPKAVKASGARVWSPNYNDFTAADLEEAHALGLKVIPWTINESADMERFIDMGVDGIISDRPDRLREALGKRGRNLPAATPVKP